MTADPDALVVHYVASLPVDPPSRPALDLLDGRERDRADRLRCPDARRRFLWRRILRRRVLAEALGADPVTLAFAALCPVCGARDHGKPYLPDAPQLHFSAAQSGEHTVVAIGAMRLGVDVQVPSDDLDQAADAFSPRERMALGGASRLHHAVLWTRKEAYLKALGIGLSTEPARVETLGRHQVHGAGGPPLWARSWSRAEVALSLACATARPVRLRRARADPLQVIAPAGVARALPKRCESSI